MHQIAFLLFSPTITLVHLLSPSCIQVSMALAEKATMQKMLDDERTAHIESDHILKEQSDLALQQKDLFIETTMNEIQKLGAFIDQQRKDIEELQKKLNDNTLVEAGSVVLTSADGSQGTGEIGATSAPPPPPPMPGMDRTAVLCCTICIMEF